MRRALLSTVLLAAACAAARYLTWDARPPAPSTRGQVAVNVFDHREEKKGGKDARVIGVQPGAFGMLEAIRLAHANDVADQLTELVMQAVRAAGVGVSPPGENGPKLDVEVSTLWCVGLFPVYQVHIAATATYTNADTVRTITRLGADADAGDCQAAYHKALSQLFPKISAVVAPPVAAPVIAAPSPSPAP